MADVEWDIRREGRSWNAGEVEQRWSLTPEKMEMTGGKVFWTDEERLKMLGLLLENVGVDQAIRLGDARVWREAVTALDNSR